MPSLPTYLGLLSAAVFCVAWGTFNAVEIKLQRLIKFRTDGVETMAQIVSHEARTWETSGIRGGKTKHTASVYRVEFVIPTGRKVQTALHAPRVSEYFLDDAHPLPFSRPPQFVRIWYMPDDPENIRKFTDEPAVPDQDLVKRGRTFVVIGGLFGFSAAATALWRWHRGRPR